MSKGVAIMSMSVDGYVADLNDGVAEVFDWYFASGDVEFQTGGSDPMTFKVSGPSAEHLGGLWSELGAVLTGRRTFDVADGRNTPALRSTQGVVWICCCAKVRASIERLGCALSRGRRNNSPEDANSGPH